MALARPSRRRTEVPLRQERARRTFGGPPMAAQRQRQGMDGLQARDRAGRRSHPCRDRRRLPHGSERPYPTGHPSAVRLGLAVPRPAPSGSEPPRLLTAEHIRMLYDDLRRLRSKTGVSLRMLQALQNCVRRRPEIDCASGFRRPTRTVAAPPSLLGRSTIRCRRSWCRLRKWGMGWGTTTHLCCAQLRLVVLF